MIAMHTFFVVFLRWSMRRRSLFVMLGMGWLLVLLIVVIGPAGYKVNKGSFCECRNCFHLHRVFTYVTFQTV